MGFNKQELVLDCSPQYSDQGSRVHPSALPRKEVRLGFYIVGVISRRPVPGRPAGAAQPGPPAAPRHQGTPPPRSSIGATTPDGPPDTLRSTPRHRRSSHPQEASSPSTRNHRPHRPAAATRPACSGLQIGPLFLFVKRKNGIATQNFMLTNRNNVPMFKLSARR